MYILNYLILKYTVISEVFKSFPEHRLVHPDLVRSRLTERPRDLQDVQRAQVVRNGQEVLLRCSNEIGQELELTLLEPAHYYNINLI